MLLPLIQTKLQELSLLQSKWKSILDPLLSVAPLQFASYTPTLLGVGTVLYLTAFWVQIGKVVLVFASWQNGTVGATSYPSISLPNSAFIDSSRVSSGNSLLGFGWQGPTSSSAGAASLTFFVYPLPQAVTGSTQNSLSSLFMTSKLGGTSNSMPLFSAFNPFNSHSNAVVLFGVPVQ